MISNTNQRPTRLLLNACWHGSASHWGCQVTDTHTLTHHHTNPPKSNTWLADDLTRDATPHPLLLLLMLLHSTISFIVHNVYTLHMTKSDERTKVLPRRAGVKICGLRRIVVAKCSVCVELSTLKHRIDIISEWFNDSQGYYTIHHWVCVCVCGACI